MIETIATSYMEIGAMGSVLVLFASQVYFMNKNVMGRIDDLDEMIVKLIDRFNVSDNNITETLQRIDDAGDRRYEAFTQHIYRELNEVSDSLQFVRGRLNGKS